MAKIAAPRWPPLSDHTLGQEWANTNRSRGSRLSTEADGQEVPITELGLIRSFARHGAALSLAAFNGVGSPFRSAAPVEPKVGRRLREGSRCWGPRITRGRVGGDGGSVRG
jgi:hypothetical protein